MDTITGDKHSQLQKEDESDVTSYDVSVNLSDTFWRALCATFAMSTTEHVHRLLDGEEHFTRSEGRGKDAEAHWSLFYLADDIVGVWPVHFEVSGGHDH